MNHMTRGNLLLAEMQIEDMIKTYEAVGVAAAIVEADGTTVYQKFWGYADKDTKQELNENTIFGLASVTKSFTALAIMQLAEQGRIHLDDPVSKYIPEFTNKNQKKVTIAHLLYHSGGFFPLPRILVGDVAKKLGLSEDKDGDFAYNEAIAVEGARQVAERLDSLTEDNGLNGYPGENFSYCNDGFGLLSEIVRREGQEDSFAEYLNRHILEPLQMRRSFCDFVRPARDDNSAVLYKKVDGEMKGSRDYHDNAFVLNGGGAMKSTLDDLKKYVLMYLNRGEGPDGERLLSRYGIGEMCKGHQNYLARGSYGYGLSIGRMDDLTVIGHGGSLPGVSSNIAWSYEAGAAVIILCNTSGVPAGLMSDALLKAYNGHSPIDKRDSWRETVWSDDTIAAACGLYESGEGTSVKLFEKEPGVIGAEVDGEAKAILPVNGEAAILRSRYSDGYLRLCRKESGAIYAISYGSRMIPRKKPAGGTEEGGIIDGKKL